MMVRFQLVLVLLLLVKILPARAVDVVESAPYQKPKGLEQAIGILNQTETGRMWYRKAAQIRVPIREGKISKTEITATRIVEGDQERLQFVSQVLISQDKDPVFQALDLAHELVHAVNDKKNPFDPNMNATEYVEHGIEGEGGEANAIAEECKVGKEIVAQFKGVANDPATDVARESPRAPARATPAGGFGIKEESIELIKARCRVVWKLDGDDTKWKTSFYQLGHYYRNFVKEWLSTRPGQVEVESWKQKLARRSPVFSSAAAHKPYPVALLEEYFEVTRVICERAKSAASKFKAFAGFEARCRALP